MDLNVLAGGAQAGQQPKPQGWGLNPISDFMKGTTSLGNWINDRTHIGNLDLGLGSVVSTAANIVPGIVNLAATTGYNLGTGKWGKVAKTGEELGQQFANSAVNTFTDLGTLGGLAPWTHRWENQIGNMTHGFIQPTSLMDYAQGNEYTNGNHQGILGGVLNDALNLTLVADGATAMAKAGEVGAAATDVLAAERGAKLAEVDNIGSTPEQIQAAGAGARQARLAEHSGGDAALEAQIAERVKLIEDAQKYRHAVTSVIQPTRPFKILGRAASERLSPSLPEEVGAPVAAEQTPVPGATLEPRPLEGLPGASEGTLQGATPEGAFAANLNSALNYGGEAPPNRVGPTTQFMSVEDLRALEPGNALNHDINDLTENIRQHGMQEPIHVTQNADGTFTISEGNHRLAAAEAAGLTEVPVVATRAGGLGVPAEPVLPSEIGLNARGPEAQVPQVEAQALKARVLENVPSAYQSYLERSAPVPEWARTIVKYLPEPMVKALQAFDRHRMGREYYRIARETKVALNVVARAVENDPAIVGLKERAQQMMLDRMPGVKPEVASQIIGERIDAALVFGPLWDELENLRDQLPPGLVDQILGFKGALPPEFDTPEFRQEIKALAEPIRQLRLKHLDELKSSPFFGAQGLENADLSGAVMTSKEIALYNQAADLLKEAAETEAAGKQRAISEITAKVQEREAATAAGRAPSAEGDRAREAAKTIEEEGRDAAGAKAIDLRQERERELALADQPSPEGERLRAQDAEAEQSARSAAEEQARLARIEQQRQLARAAGDPRYRTGLGPLDPLEVLDATNKAAQAGEVARALEQRLAQDRMTPPTLVDAAAEADRKWYAEHMTRATALAREGRALEAAIENGTLPSDRQAALVRENAQRADIRAQNEAGVRVLRANKHIADLKTAIESRLLPENIAAAKLREKAGTLQEQVAESLSTATGKRVAAKWQPLILAGKRMAQAVEQYPELEPILESMPKIFGDAIDYATEHGFDPTHMPDLTEQRVRQMVNGSVRLGGAAGKEFESQARMERTGTLREQNLADRSIDGIIAGLVHATQETRTNMVVNWIDRIIARDMPTNARGARIVPEGWVRWDSVKRSLLDGINEEGEHQALRGDANKMIPKAVARVINEYATTASNPFARAMQYATNPWRFFMLTLNPAFYMHHIVGHLILALAQEEGGFHLNDWRQAYRAARGKFLDLPQVTGQNIVGAELGKGGVLEYPNLRTALAQGGRKAAMEYITAASHKAITVSDSFARAVDYFSQRRAGYTDMEALQHANRALVDYGDLSPFEKNVARSILPFYGFQKGILKIALSMPIDHPLVTQVLMQIGNFQREQAKDENGNPLPEGYQGVVDLGPLGHRNLKSMSPFKDIGSLITPEGLVANLQYALNAAIRTGMNAPAPFTKAGIKVGPYGNLVPKVSLLKGIEQGFFGGPQGQLMAGLSGNSTKTPSQAVQGFFGFPEVTPERLAKAGQRTALSEAEVANLTPQEQDQITAFPVDSNSALNILAKAKDLNTLNVPAGMTEEEIKAAIKAQQDKQKEAARITRLTGITRAGQRVKKGGSHAGIRRRTVRKGRIRHARIKITKSHLKSSYRKVAIRRVSSMQKPRRIV